MRVGFIGAGKVGFSLGKYLSFNQVDVTGYYSRNPKSAHEAADFTASEVFEKIDDVVDRSDVIFITVPDSTIGEVWKQVKLLPIEGKMICHCSGVLSSEIFEGCDATGAYSFSVHPLLAVSDKFGSYKEFSTTLFTIEGSEERIEDIRAILEKCGNKVRAIKAKDKIRYHGAAVLASNLMLGLLETATEELCDCGFDREEAVGALIPLALGNINHLKHQSLEEALTGPVERGDTLTVGRHLDAFSGEDREIYLKLSKKALLIAKRKNIDRDYTKLEGRLNNG